MTEKRALNATERDGFRDILLVRRNILRGDVSHQESQTLNQSRLKASGDLSTVPFHMADVGTDNFQYEFTLGLIENEEEELREIDAAIQRLADDTFGVCETCDKAIRRARLRALPYTRVCIECKREEEAQL